jgi:WD40 repeat protein
MLTAPAWIEGGDAIRAVAIAADGTLLAYGAAKQVTVVASASASAEVVTTYQHGFNGYIYGLTWSPDGRLIASCGGDATVQVWEATSGRHQFSYRGHADLVQAVAWSPDGSLIASGSRDVQVWEAATGRKLASLACFQPMHLGRVSDLAWSRDGRLAVACQDRSLQVWEAESQTRLLHLPQAHSHALTGVAWSPDGARLASCAWEQLPRIWDACTGAPLLAYSHHHAPLQAIAWSPDGTRIATASGGGYGPRPTEAGVHVWDAASGQTLSTMSHEQLVCAIAWSPDGAWLAFGSADGALCRWFLGTEASADIVEGGKHATSTAQTA